jgi:hypothetical protein
LRCGIRIQFDSRWERGRCKRITAPHSAPTGDCESGNARALRRQAQSKTVKDYRASIEKLRADAAEAALIRDLATDYVKRELYDRLCNHFNRLADEIEAVVKAQPTP